MAKKVQTKTAARWRFGQIALQMGNRAKKGRRKRLPGGDLGKSPYKGEQGKEGTKETAAGWRFWQIALQWEQGKEGTKETAAGWRFWRIVLQWGTRQGREQRKTETGRSPYGEIGWKRNPLAIFALFLLFVGAGWGILALIFGFLTRTSFISAMASGNISHFWRVLYILSLYLLLIAALWLFWIRILGKTFLDLGLTVSGKSGIQAGVGFLWAFLVAFLYYAILLFPGLARYRGGEMPGFSFLALNILGSLGIALTEETLFRGFILRLFLTRWGVSASVIISSLIFALPHIFRKGDLLFKAGYFVGLFIFGFILCRFVLSLNSLYFSIGFHWGLILLLILVSKIEPFRIEPTSPLLTGLNDIPLAGLVLWIALIAAFALFAPAKRLLADGEFECER